MPVIHKHCKTLAKPWRTIYAALMQKSLHTFMHLM